MLLENVLCQSPSYNRLLSYQEYLWVWSCFLCLGVNKSLSKFCPLFWFIIYLRLYCVGSGKFWIICGTAKVGGLFPIVIWLIGTVNWLTGSTWYQSTNPNTVTYVAEPHSSSLDVEETTICFEKTTVSLLYSALWLNKKKKYGLLAWTIEWMPNVSIFVWVQKPWRKSCLMTVLPPFMLGSVAYSGC